ncbi:glycosyltransferase family 4 protein [Devosia sp. WQ 349]|uniref:glycosyltransferase family 4 protein n=1 Tax=Devosia sp. WQ 349K1 TaxID=2800329 RepID=UPI0019064BA5|nr:glycosyltransferase family 4 protein [Devosia sp. WQ 349K1]MBK1796002.1 glycosyltransferase family 4 protein [Devosia sp. WQ 349K1]
MSPTSAINTSNVHAGGGLQATCSFLAEAQPDLISGDWIAVLASEEVSQNLASLSRDFVTIPNYEVLNVYGALRGQSTLARKLRKFRCVFTVFGPLYIWKPRFKSVVGFAQAWIIYPQNECYKRLPVLQRLKTRLKFWIQAQFFKRADVLVVELEHVKEGLVRELGFPAERIHVVHNCLSSLYAQPELWQDLTLSRSQGELALGFLGRNYIHKNTEIFPEIVSALKRNHGISARFYVTFTEDEWRACSPEFRKACVNVGQLTVAQCPKFYRSLDAVVFPSLLECFSATPLEAMAMEKPLFASDRPFNRDICQGHAHYFDPLSPASAAAEIAKVFGGEGTNAAALKHARDHAFGFSSAKERARKYLDLLTPNA